MKKVFAFPILLVCFFSVEPQINAQDNSWSKKYKSDNSAFEINTLSASWNNHVIMAGTAVVSIDSTGHKTWSKKFSGDGNSYARFTCMTGTSDSCLLLAGVILSSANPVEDFCILKLDLDGEITWSKALNVGVSGEPLSVRETVDHGFIMTGRCQNNPGEQSNTLLVRLDSAGNILWDRIITYGDYSSEGVAADPESGDGFILSGNLVSQDLEDRVLMLIRFSSSGDIIWAKRQYPTMGYTVSMDARKVVDGYLCLYIDQDHYCHLMKTDLSGNLIWIIRYLYPREYYDFGSYSKLYPLVSGGLVFVTPSPNWSFDFGALFRINENGSLLWAKQVYSATEQVIQAADGALVIFGSSIAGVGVEGNYLLPFGLSKIDSAGVYNSCTDPLFLTTSQVNHGLEDLNVTVTSGASSAPFDVVANPYYLNTLNGCVEQYSGEKETNRNDPPVRVFPNPTSGTITIVLHPQTSEKINRIVIFNPTGLQIFMSSDPVSQIDLTSFPSGLYLVKVETTERNFTQRLILRH